MKSNFLGAVILGLALSNGVSAAPTHYTVSMPHPETHYFEVQVRVEDVKAPQLRLVMPVWTPGSYLLREFARHVQDFSASAGRTPLLWQKINKNTWQIETGGASVVEAKYRVYANELGVRSSDLDAEHGYFNGATLFMYPEGRIREAYKLTVVPKDEWQVATGLDPVVGEKNTFFAPDYDVLIDSPVEMGKFESLEFAVRGVPHQIAVHGPAKFDRGRMVGDIRRIVEKQAELFGEIPYQRYLFIVHAGISGGGGLEHLNSTSLQTARLSFRKEKDWESFLDLVSHEFFHLWNVKRIRPQVLGPFDYTQENYTRALWISEGITDYYGTLTLARAGLITPKRYLKLLSTVIQGYRATPGRLVQSASESSFDAWIKHYRPDENSRNSSISYYDKGNLLGLMLDLEIRQRTAGARSLDDVMRSLNDNYAKKGIGFPEADFRKVAEQVAGGSLENFFRDYVDGVKELPLEQFLAKAGLVLGSGPTADEKPEERESYDTVSLGVVLEERSGRFLAAAVLAGSPAEVAGVNAGDEVLALDSIRVTAADFAERLRDYKPGDDAQLTVFRDNVLRQFRATMAPPPPRLNIQPLPGADAAQRRVFSGWLGVELSALPRPN